MAQDAPRVRRGPKPNPDRGVPSGFRLTERARFELQVAAVFIGTRNVQGTLDVAVEEFLSRMRGVEGFSEALIAAEASQQRRSGVRRIDHQGQPDARSAQRPP